MKLSKINESGGGQKSYFHGTNNIRDVLDGGGLVVGHPRDKQSGFVANRSSVYLGPLVQATAYGLGILEVVVDGGAVYFADEDAVINVADPEDESWVSERLVNVPSNKVMLVHRATMEAGGWEAWPSLSGKLPVIIQKLNIRLKDGAGRDGAGLGVVDNITIPEKIGFDGAVRIVAGYEVERVGEAGYEMSVYQVVDVVYGSGSLELGYKFKGAAANNFWVR